MIIFYLIISLIIAIILFFVYDWLMMHLAILKGKWILIKMLTKGLIKEKSYRKLYLIFVILFASNDTTDMLMKEAIKSSEEKERKDKDLGGPPTCE